MNNQAKKRGSKARQSYTALKITALAGAICAFSAFAIGDEVILRDGTVYNGTVISKTRRSVEMDTKVHGISTRITLDRRMIKSITEDEDMVTDTDSGTDSGTGTVSTPAKLPTMESAAEEENKILKRDGYQLILEVPMNGTFGQDIYPLGIANSLEYAKEQGVTDVVFRINSGGGEVWCAKEIVDIMNEYRGYFKMHMLIESAISASIWPAFNCDTITMVPGSDFGGAVVYTMNATGSAEVDLKMNSIWANKLTSAAEGQGYSGFVIKAMMLSKSALYAKEQRDGTWKLYDSTEGLGDDYDTISGPDDILTLTYNQAVKYGIVQGTENGRSLEDFAELHEIGPWDNAGDEADEIVSRDVKKSKQLRSRLMSTIQSFFREANLQGGDVRQMGSALNQMTKHLGTYKRLLNQAEDMRMPAILEGFEDVIDIAFWESEIEARKAEIRRSRYRGP